MNEIPKIKKVIEIVDKKHLSKMFDESIKFEVGEIRIIGGKHYIVDILIPTFYFRNEPYESRIQQWWDKLTKVKDAFRDFNNIGSLNFQPIEKK
jgi:hypothetical protein